MENYTIILMDYVCIMLLEYSSNLNLFLLQSLEWT